MNEDKGMKLVTQFLEDLSREEIHRMVEASNKLKEDSNFNYRAYIGEGLYKYAAKQFGFDLESNSDDEAIDAIVKGFVEELSEMEDIDNLYDEIHKDIKDAKESIKEAVDEFIENESKYRNMMEVSLLEQAEKVEDEDTKKKMIDTSKAYTDGYTFARLIKYIESDEFRKKYKKAHKRLSLLDSDFTYIVQKVANDTTATLTNLRKSFENCINIRFAEDEVVVIITAIGMYARDKSSIKYNPDMWHIFCVYNNLMRLLILPKKITKFDNEKIEYLKKLCDTAKAFADSLK